jgi:hypothetical protein
MKTPTAQEEDYLYVPKGGMCSACTKSLDDCSSLDFDSMKVMYRTENVATVKCTGFTTPAKPIKPKKKVIDLSVLIESGIDVEVSQDGKGQWYLGGQLVQIHDGIHRYECFNSTQYEKQCRPRMSHIHAWQGGECPLPEGFMVKVWWRNSTRGDVSAVNNLALRWSNKNYPSDIIAFEILGLADGYVMPWEVSDE